MKLPSGSASFSTASQNHKLAPHEFTPGHKCELLTQRSKGRSHEDTRRRSHSHHRRQQWVGLATAKLFQQACARVVISGRSQESLDQAVKELGAGVIAVRSDVSKLSDLDVLFSVVAQNLGRIDVLFANAGIAKFAPVSDVSEDFYNEIFDINFKGVYFTLKKASPHLNDNASVILNTSFANRKGVPTTSVYARPRRRCAPGTKRLFGTGSPGDPGERDQPWPDCYSIYGKLGLPKEVVEAFAAHIVSQVPMQRFGTPEQVAQTVLFLASSSSSYVTGVELSVDGRLG